MRRVIVPIAAIILGAAAAFFVARAQWVDVGAVDIPWQGWLAMGIGVLATAALGGGLMALVFYSSRQGYDDRANWPGETPDDHPPEDPPE
jgi:hypothetical protein